MLDHAATGLTMRPTGAARAPWRVIRGNGAWGRIRTTDTRIFNPLLYQLSYPGEGPIQRGGKADRARRGVYRRAYGRSPAASTATLSLLNPWARAAGRRRSRRRRRGRE